MKKKDLDILNLLLKRTEDLPDILHLRARPLGYELTEEDKKLLFDTYQELDNILKEVGVFINVKFPNRQDYIYSWNQIDFDTKIGGFKIVTTDREHIKSEWKKGLYDLKSLIKTLVIEVKLRIDDVYENINPLFKPEEWDKYLEERIEKRANQADFFLDIVVDKGLINLDKTTVRKHFKNWFKESKDFDLQIKNGDFAIEDGDIQIVPDFSKENIPEFLKWFENERNSFIDYLKHHEIDIDNNAKNNVVNHGNMIVNNQSQIQKQTFENDIEKKESNWTKANVLTAIIVGIITILGILWQIYKSK